MIGPLAIHAEEGESSYENDPHPPAPYIPEGARNQDLSTGKLAGKTLRIKRPLLMVSNLQKSLDFYENVIGFELYAVQPTYDRDHADSVGHKSFNTPVNTRKRIATLNTSDELRGLTLREIPDVDFNVPQSPHIFTLLLEASDILELMDRAVAAKVEINPPTLGEIPATDKSPMIRYMEFSLLDPDGYLISVFKYYTDVEEDEWERAVARYGVFEDF